MKDTATKARFVELRAQGLSYSRIAAELQISKQTLIDWGRDLQEEIDNLKAVELEAIQERFLMTKEKRLEAFGGLLQRIGEELKTRNLSDVETPKLFEMFMKTYATLKEEGGTPNVLSAEEIRVSQRERQERLDVGLLTFKER